MRGHIEPGARLATKSEENRLKIPDKRQQKCLFKKCDARRRLKVAAESFDLGSLGRVPKHVQSVPECSFFQTA